MFECDETKAFGLKWLKLTGRIDAMTAGGIGRRLDALLSGGDRVIGVDLEGVNYISSAGIRVFLISQKKLLRVDGQIVLARVRPDVLDILKISGLDTIFRIGATREEAAGAIGRDKAGTPVLKTLNNISLTILEKDAPPGSLTALGDPSPLAQAAYGPDDAATIPSSHMQFGLGLGSLGQAWDHFKGLFGEAIVVDHNLFFYPAIKNPAVDFMLWAKGNPSIPYRFLNGLAFQGAYQYVTSFESAQAPISLDDLIQALFQLSGAPLIGIVFLGESRGMWGMHLRRVPVKELYPEPVEDVFSPVRIHDWMDLPVEPEFINHVIAGVGVAVREKELIPSSLAAYFSEGQDFHVHGGIFGKGLFSADPTGFDREMLRIVTEFEPLRIQHLMGRSRFRNGVVGVMALEPGT